MTAPSQVRIMLTALALTTLIITAVTAAPTSIPSLTPAVLEVVGHVGLSASEMYCDWPRTTDNCKGSDEFKTMLLASSISHLLTGILGIWLMVYRNQGLNSKIVTELFILVGDGIRPKPMDCIIFFTTMASFFKLPSNLLNILNILPQNMALRIAVEGIYWVFVCFACTSYFVGLLYAMPVTTREGIIAVYQPEVSANGSVLRPIHVILPSNTTKNIILTIGILYPSLTSFGFGVISGVLYDRGNYHASRIMMQIQYTNWVIIFWSLAVVLFYYGLKYTFILRANIIIAEAELKAPRSTFGIGNLKSRSPARFLFVQLQITGFGGSAVAIIAGGGCFAWVVAQQKILSTKSVGLPLAGAFLWTTAFTLAFFVLLGLVGAQTKRNRRRGIHQPPSGQSESEHLSQIRPKSVLKSEGTDSPYSISNSSKHSRSLSISRIEQETPTYPIQPYRTSFGTNGGGSEDNSILHTGIINEKYSMDHTQNCWTSANNGNSEVEQQRQRDFSTSVKNLSNDGELELNQPLSLLPSHSTVLSCINAAGPPSSTEICNRSAIRESVFGGRTPREETNTRTSRSSISSPPQSPISLSGFNSIRRSQSGRISAMHPRASISSITSIRSSERQNSTSSSADACGPISTTRPKDIISNPSASKKDTHSISIYVPPPQHPLATPPTPVSVREQSEAVSVPVSTNSSSSLLPKQHSQPIPRPKDRKHSIDNTRATGHNTSVSAPISVTVASSASRGAGGGYRSKSIGADALPLSSS